MSELVELITSKRRFMVVKETSNLVFCRPPVPRPVYDDLDLSLFSSDYQELYQQGFKLCAVTPACVVFEKMSQPYSELG